MEWFGLERALKII